MHSVMPRRLYLHSSYVENPHFRELFNQTSKDFFPKKKPGQDRAFNVLHLSKLFYVKTTIGNFNGSTTKNIGSGKIKSTVGCTACYIYRVECDGTRGA